MRFAVNWVVLTLALAATSAFSAGGRITVGDGSAPPNPIDVAFEKCESDWKTLSDWRSCIGTAEHAWRALLNKNYAALAAKLKGNRKKELVASQVAWQAACDAESRFFNAFDDLQVRLGREGYVVLERTQMLKVRERALEMVEYNEVLGD